MAIISFGRIDKKLFLVIIVEIVNLINLIILQEVDEKNYNDTLITFEEELGTIIIGLLMLYKLKKSPSIKYKNKRSFKYIIYLFILRLIKSSYETFYNGTMSNDYKFKKILNTVNGIELILMSIGTYILLKYKYYIHHMISMFIYFSLGVTIDLIIRSFTEIHYNYVYIYIIYMLNDVTVFCYLKYMMDKLYYNYKEVVLYWGLIGLIINLITKGSLSIYQYKKEIKDSILDGLKDYFDNINISTFIFFQLFYFIINRGIYNYLVILMIDYFKPNFIIITDELYVYIRLIAYQNRPNKYYTFIPFLFQILALLFYFEILEFNCFKWNKNTIKNIQKREAKLVNESRSESLNESIVELNDTYLIEERETILNEESISYK